MNLVQASPLLMVCRKIPIQGKSLSKVFEPFYCAFMIDFNWCNFPQNCCSRSCDFIKSNGRSDSSCCASGSHTSFSFGISSTAREGVIYVLDLSTVSTVITVAVVLVSVVQTTVVIQVVMLVLEVLLFVLAIIYSFLP